MNSLKPILTQVKNALPYFFFSMISFYIFFNHLNFPDQGFIWWSGLIFLSLAVLFLIQWKYQIKTLNLILGIIALLWSIWMTLAALSDLAKADSWDRKSTEFALTVLPILAISYYCSISILNKKQGSSSNNELAA